MSPLRVIDPGRPGYQKPGPWVSKKPFLTAEWRHLVMLNYEVDAEMLAPYVPRHVEIDRWQGRTYVSLIGFLFLNTRVRNFPVPFHRNFEEVNLRFYVRRGDQRGVVFIREIVPRRAVALVANSLYGENYVSLPMRHRLELFRFEYSWRVGGKWNSIAASELGRHVAVVPGSHEEFITEHYWGYTRRSASLTVEYRVEHPSWKVRSAGSGSFQGSVAGLYPCEFEFIGQRPPDTAFVADGSIVAVFRGNQPEYLAPTVAS
ncbi:MAG: YqjF family protein [Candidatus Acidiferrales bacterium]